MGNEQSSINNTIKIGVIGLEKYGKSTLLTKLIGQDIILTSCNQSTNILITNTMSKNPELISHNTIIGQGVDDINDAFKKITLYAENSDILTLKTKIKSLYDINSNTIQFYDTIGLELVKNSKGKIVTDIVMKCEVILYVLNFQDLVYDVIFRHYKLLKKHNKKVYIIVTHIDLFAKNAEYNSNMKIKNMILNKYMENDIKLNPDDIIPLNLFGIDDNDGSFATLVNIINNLKIELENMKLKRRLDDVEFFQNGQIVNGLFGAGVSIISSIVKR
jgi:GTPase Era involved in 16S rRNA processing